MGLNRRTFMKFLAGAGAGVTISPIPWKLLDDVSIWTQNWPWIPSNIKGANNFVRTVSKYCPSGLGYTVRLVDERPVRVLPDQAHPNGGGITAMAAAEVQMLHSPGRLKQPLRRSPDGKLIATTWDDAMQRLTEGLKNAGSSVAAVSGDENGTINEILSSFINASGSDKTFIMPSEAQCAAIAWQLMDGLGEPGYDIEKSDYVLAIGASILESWGTVTRNRRAFAARAEHGQAPKVPFIYVGPVQNNTAAGCDQWLPIKPGTEVIFGLGLANLIMAERRRVTTEDFYEFKTMAEAYTPEKVEEITGLPAARLKDLAANLLKARKPLVICGSSFGQGGGAGPAMIGFSLNLLLGNMNAEGGLKALPEQRTAVSGGKTRAELFRNNLVEYMVSGNVSGNMSGNMPKAMLFYEANPVFALPENAKVVENLSKVGFKVSFSTFLNETAELCDLVLPIPMGLERVDDVYTPYGSGQAVYSLCQQVLKTPLADARPADQVLSEVANTLGFKIGVKNLKEAITAKAASLGADLKKLQKGAPFVNPNSIATPLSLKAEILGPIAKQIQSKAASDGLTLAPQFRLSMGGPNTGIPPFNTKTIRDTELSGKDMFVSMNSQTAAAHSLSRGDMVELSNKSGSIRARVHVFEGVVPGVVAMTLGFGHSAMDEFSQNKGANAMKIASVSAEPGTGLGVWAQSGVNIAKVRG